MKYSVLEHIGEEMTSVTSEKSVKGVKAIFKLFLIYHSTGRRIRCLRTEDNFSWLMLEKVPSLFCMSVLQDLLSLFIVDLDHCS